MGATEDTTVDLYSSSLVYPVLGRRVSRRIRSRARHYSPATRRPADAAICRSGRHGGVVSDVVPHEVPIYEPTIAYRFGCRHSRLQPHHDADDEHGSLAAGLFRCRHRQTAGHIREHVEYPAVDDA